MKKILLILFCCFLVVFVNGQYPIVQNLGNTNTRVQVPADGGFQANLINRPYTDTTAANLTNVKFYSGAQIYTTVDSVFWIRNVPATRWLPIGGGSAGGGGGGGGTIVSIEIYLGDSLIICYSDGSCDTIYGGDVLQGWQSTLDISSTLNKRNVITGGNNSFVWNGLDSLILNGTNVSTSPSVFGMDDAFYIYRQPSDAQIRIQTASVFPLLINGGTSTNGIVLNPNSYNASGGNVRFSHHDLDYIDQSFISGGASEIARLGIDANRRFYIKGMYDSTSIAFRSTGSASVYVDSSRFTTAYGTATASANDLTLPFNGNTFNITGNTQLNAITTYAWQSGSIIYLKFTGTPTIADNTAGGAGTAPIQLSGNVNFTASAGDLLALQYDGTNWTEIGRSYAGQINGALFARTDARNNTGSAMYFSSASQNLLLDSTRLTVRDFTTTAHHIAQTNGTDSSWIDIRRGTNASTKTVNANVRNGTTLNRMLINGSLAGFYNDNGTGITSTINVGTDWQTQAANTDGSSTGIYGTPDSIGINTDNGLITIDTMQTTIDTTWKPVVWKLNGSAGGYLKQFNSWGEIGLGVTWNGILNPTGDQALTFEAGESSTWTDQNTTEDLFTVNSSTGTTNSLFSLNRTGTALASGNNIMELVSSGANGTNAITATGLRVSVTNTNATSGTNTALDLTATGATTANNAITSTGRVIFAQADGQYHFITAEDLTPAGGESYIKTGHTASGFTVMEFSARAGRNTTISALGAEFKIASTSGFPLILLEGSTEIARIRAAGMSIMTGAAATARLHIATNTTAAGTAPIKLTTSSAALMTAAEAGAMEVLVDSLYYTGSGGTRRRLAYAKEIGSFQFDKGADVAAANDLVLGQDGNLFTITGATTINAIATLNWQAGSTIAFIFTGAPLVKNNTAGGAGTATMLLAGRVDFQAAAGDYIAFQYDGTNWYETNRKLAATGGVYTFSNGLTESPAGTVKLGGTLSDATTTLTAGANTLLITGNTAAANPILSITSTSTAAASSLQQGINVSMSGANSNSGQTTYGIRSINTHTGSSSTNIGVWGEATGGSSNTGVYGSTTNGVATQGSATSGYAFYGSATSGFGIYASVTTGVPAHFAQLPATTNTVIETLRLDRQTSGTAADGIGSMIQYYVEPDGASAQISSQLISKWTTAANATRTSKFMITGINSAITDTLMEVGGLYTLTESSATTFATATIASGSVAGGEIVVTIEANDATDYQARTLRFIWSAVNKAGTTTITLSTPEEVVTVSAGTLTATITAVDGGSGLIHFQANAASSLTQTTLRATSHFQKNY